MSSRRRLGLAAAVLVVSITVVGGLSALPLQKAAKHLRRAQDQVELASTALETKRLADARAALGEARKSLLAANNDVYNGAGLDLVGWLPVVSQNLDRLRDSVALASVVVSGGQQLLETSRPLESEGGQLEVSLSDGSVPLDVVRLAAQQATALAAQLPSAVPEDESRLLLPQTKELQIATLEEAVRRRDQLDVLGRGLGILQHLAGGDGPRRYLIAVANTAEMRGSGGMILNYGILEGSAGVLDLTAFGRIDELRLSTPLSADAVALPDDYLDRWSGFDPTLLWRNANLGADFTVVAPVLQAMYEQATSRPIDGVIQVDPQGLAAILTGVGPVTVPEVGVVDAANVVDLVLNDAYRLFPGVEERTDVLGDVAEATFRRLVDGDFPSLRPLAEALVKAVDGRHIIAASRTPVVESSAAFFRATGDLPPPEMLDYAHLAVQNVAGNKLDYYLHTELHLTGERKVGRLGSVRAEIVLTNTAPPGERSPRYIFGPFNEDQEAGLYRGIVTLYLPDGTTLEGSEGDAVRNRPVAQTEAGRPLVSYTVDIPAGETRRLVLDLRLAPRSGEEPYELVLVPSPRVRSTRVTVDITTDTGMARGEVVLGTPTVFAAGRAPRAHVTP